MAGVRRDRNQVSESVSEWDFEVTSLKITVNHNANGYFTSCDTPQDKSLQCWWSDISKTIVILCDNDAKSDIPSHNVITIPIPSALNKLFFLTFHSSTSITQMKHKVSFNSACFMEPLSQLDLWLTPEPPDWTSVSTFTFQKTMNTMWSWIPVNAYYARWNTDRCDHKRESAKAVSI